MEAADYTAFFDKHHLSNRKQSLIDPFKALCPNPFISSIDIFVQAAVAPNSK